MVASHWMTLPKLMFLFFALYSLLFGPCSLFLSWFRVNNVAAALRSETLSCCHHVSCGSVATWWYAEAITHTHTDIPTHTQTHLAHTNDIPLWLCGCPKPIHSAYHDNCKRQRLTTTTNDNDNFNLQHADNNSSDERQPQGLSIASILGHIRAICGWSPKGTWFKVVVTSTRSDWIKPKWCV